MATTDNTETAPEWVPENDIILELADRIFKAMELDNDSLGEIVTEDMKNRHDLERHLLTCEPENLEESFIAVAITGAQFEMIAEQAEELALAVQNATAGAHFKRLADQIYESSKVFSIALGHMVSHARAHRLPVHKILDFYTIVSPLMNGEQAGVPRSGV